MVNPQTATTKPNDTKILQDMKTEIMKLPVDQRISAVALYRQVERFLKETLPFENHGEQAKEESDERLRNISASAQEIISG